MNSVTGAGGPPERRELSFRTSGLRIEADASGRFTVEAVPPGQVSLRCRLGTETDHVRLATGWVAI